MHCEDAKCMQAAAPTRCTSRDDGLVVIDPAKAKGQRARWWTRARYGAVFYNEELDVPQKCTGCAHLVDEG